MKLPVITLPGLTLDTLGLYFAALGLLRLLSRNWPQVRGCWHYGVFIVVAGPNSREKLVDFLFEIGRKGQWSEYGKPWDCPQKKDTKLAQAKKPVGVVAKWRAQKAREDELLVLQSHLVPSEQRNRFNPLFGTGGNAGKRLFSSVWKKAREAILKPGRGISAEDLRADLESFLEGGSCAILGDFRAGCWFSLANKTYNSGMKKAFAEGQITPWAMLLACEAFPLLAGSTSRLIGAHTRQSAAFPFVTRAAAPKSESACGQRLGDFWAPVWNSPLSLAEACAVLQSGKAELDGRAALTAVSFAGAIVQHGVDRGVSEFRCFTLQRTTSDDTFESNLARVIKVPEFRASHTAFFRRAIALRDHLPAERQQGKNWRYQGLQGPFDHALLDLAQRIGENDESRQFEGALAVLDAMFGALAKVDRNNSHRASKITFQRLPMDWLDWLAQREDGSAEFRLAVALASLWAEKPVKAGEVSEKDFARSPQAFLAYRLGVTGRGQYWQAPKERPLRAIWSQRSLADNLCSLARRRLMESSATVDVPFRSAFQAPLADVLAFLAEETDDDLLVRWLDRLSLFNWQEGKQSREKLKETLQVKENSGGSGGLEVGLAHDSRHVLYTYFRPLTSDALFRGLQKAISHEKSFLPDSKEEPALATTGRFGSVAAALEREDVPAAWALARSAFHAQGIPIANFGASVPFDQANPSRLLAALIIPARVSGPLYHYFREHWQAPAEPDTEAARLHQ